LNINNTDFTSDAPLPKQQTSSNLKNNLLVEQKEEINLLKNENLNLKLQLDRATNRVKNNRFADSPKSSIPRCPFPRRCWCVKGNRCDFLHAKPFPNEHKHIINCPFLRRKGFCLKEDRCDFSHDDFSHDMVALRPKMTNPVYPTSFLPYQVGKQRPPNYFQQAWLPHPWPKPSIEVPFHQHPRTYPSYPKPLMEVQL
jgi:hypothetical protein